MTEDENTEEMRRLAKELPPERIEELNAATRARVSAAVDRMLRSFRAMNRYR